MLDAALVAVILWAFIVLSGALWFLVGSRGSNMRRRSARRDRKDLYPTW